MSDFEPLDLDRRPTAEMVASALRKRLLNGEHRPGEPMRESVLAPRLGVSRPTMREALQHLVREGLLTHHMHRGMVVTELGVDDVRELYRVRLALESAGIRHARDTDGEAVDLSDVRSAVEAFVDAVERQDGLALVDADMGFHASLVGLAHSPRLVEFHLATVGQLRLALGRFDRTYGDLDRQVQEHKRILRDLVQRRYDDALKHLTEHLERASDQIARFIETVETERAGDAAGTR